ncbi:MAG TPA: hypothetical protein VMR94_01375, partial [Hyphomicrobiaceae bacterium]|nr:hypothetical protein [Hyphomicrobiaceae bacterium]
MSEPLQDWLRTANNVSRSHWTKVSAVKAKGCAAQQEDLVRPQDTTPLPLWQGAFQAIYFERSCHKSTADKYVAPEPADSIAANSGNRLQQVGRVRQIAPTVSQIGGV